MDIKNVNNDINRNPGIHNTEIDPIETQSINGKGDARGTGEVQDSREATNNSNNSNNSNNVEVPDAPIENQGTVVNPEIDLGSVIEQSNEPPTPVINSTQVQTAANNTRSLGSLNPTGEAIALTDAMQPFAKPASQALNKEVINRSFNPLKSIIGEFDDPAKMYQGKALLPVRDTIAGVIAHGNGGNVPEAMQPLLAALPEGGLLLTPAHQFNVDGKPGNRVTPYGGSVGHSHIDSLLHELGKQGIRVLKVMSHINHEGQGGSVKDILEDGVGGVTHAGGFSAGMQDGKPIAIKSDWPSDYGTLSDSNRSYNAVGIGIDYQAGTKQEIEAETLQFYKENADMWDCFAGMVVPFTGSDRDRRHTSYQYNPLEIYDAASAKSVAETLAEVNQDAMLDKHGAFYCAEGQFCVANLGPKNDTLLKKSVFGSTRAGKIIEAYQQSGATPENPQVGWQYLEDNGIITQQEHNHLKRTDRTAVYLEWVPEEVKGWEDYGTYQKDGLIAEPMTVAGMAWGLIRSFMPRQGIAKTITQELQTTYKNGDAAVKGGIEALIGTMPNTTQGAKALAEFANKCATATLVGFLQNDDFKNKLLAKSGIDEITNDADKKKVRDTYDNFVKIVMATDPNDQSSLDAALRQADTQFRDLKVKRSFRNPVTGDYDLIKDSSTMLYAAPYCYNLYAQHPELFNSFTLRYVTNFQHAEQVNGVGEAVG